MNTRFLKLFSQTYWFRGGGRYIKEIYDNRSLFMEVYDLKEPTYNTNVNEFVFSITNNRNGFWKKDHPRMEHIEQYIDSAGNIVLVTSPYGKQEFVNEEWKRIPNIYGGMTESYVLVKPIQFFRHKKF